MSLTLTACEDASPDELRAEDRTHLFMSAILTAGTASTPVNVRNLSASGALVEGPSLPAAGVAVTLRRARNAADGFVAWRSSSQAGITFRSNIFVADWLPRRGGSRQSAIDRYLFEARMGSGREASALTQPGQDGAGSALAELRSLRSDLVTLGDLLVQDIILVSTHPEIQLMDIALQRIDRLLLLAEQDPAAVAGKP